MPPRTAKPSCHCSSDQGNSSQGHRSTQGAPPDPSPGKPPLGLGSPLQVPLAELLQRGRGAVSEDKAPWTCWGWCSGLSSSVGAVATASPACPPLTALAPQAGSGPRVLPFLPVLEMKSKKGLPSHLILGGPLPASRCHPHASWWDREPWSFLI